MATTLTKTQLDLLRGRLEEERTRILRVLRAPATNLAPDDDVSDFEETAQRATERSQQVEIVERERAILAEVERALAKFKDGKYGVSEETGAPIRYERLAAMPWARGDVDE
jgi:DnaK suppressor protein